MLDSVPPLWKMVFYFRRLNIPSWMSSDFYFRYHMFVKDEYDSLYNKYLQKILIAEIYEDHNI